jgi:hypothetical protein
MLAIRALVGELLDRSVEVAMVGDRLDLVHDAAAPLPVSSGSPREWLDLMRSGE